MIITRRCPGCHQRALVPVEGGLGRMGRCPACGWTGPMRRDEKLHWPADLQRDVDDESIARAMAEAMGWN